MSDDFDADIGHSGDVGAAAPTWAVFGDLMSVMLGAFVLIMLGVIGVQIELSAKLEREVKERRAETQRRETLEKALAGPLADRDPAARAHWSGADWARAEAAGLVEIAPAPARADHQAIQDFAPAGAAWPAGEEPVWWDGDDEKWHTRFPPPADFHGEEDGAYGDDEYSRELTAEEEHLVEAPYRARLAARRKVEGAARDRWFALLAAPETDDGAAIFSHAAP